MTHTFQSGIIPEASSDALFITFDVKKERITDVKKALSMSPAIIRELQQQFPDAHLYATIGISHSAWRYFDSSAHPAELTPFPRFSHNNIEVGETEGELVFHIRSTRRDASYLLANALYQAFDNSLTIIDEISCFKYLDNRDLTGFVDGTENPESEARKAVALVGEEDIHFKDGSYLNLMRFEHDLNKWEQLDLKTQEDTYGRTKYANEEYASKDKSVHAHTKRTSLKDHNGKSLEILRHSMPFASLTCKGLMFASYSKTPSIFNQMLKSMVEGDENGNQDHLMRYTIAKTGNAFFVPSVTWLESMGDSK
ncbi:putative deferrochelatase/peroxidase YfeX [Marinomonas spartinae]|uniref:Dyp-type peroxidase n=1 Tax=Marinomonas spartinae TaxID=1792290 RepID=UPI000808EDBD|nr:Dyp-type peroxidase [Marinomonas spartinae]SBS36700.1 putative deferrochelatase/peroxidase YfeX [Marinomonas spartinae]